MEGAGATVVSCQQRVKNTNESVVRLLRLLRRCAREPSDSGRLTKLHHHDL